VYPVRVYKLELDFGGESRAAGVKGSTDLVVEIGSVVEGGGNAGGRFFLATLVAVG